MTLTISTQAISAAVKQAAKIAARTSTLPMLEHIALCSEKGQLHITANDMQRCATEAVECEGDITACCVRAKTLAAALQTARSESITLTTPAEGELVLRAGRNRQTFKTLEYRAFPQPELNEQTELAATPAELAKAISAVKYAAATKDVRYYLNGIYIGEGHVVATDGHRMAHTELENGEHQPLIIPQDAINDIIERANGNRVCATENQLVIHSRTGWYSTQLVDGKYPDWKRVLPRHNSPATLTANAQDITAAIRAASVIANTEGDKFVAVKIRHQGEHFEIEGRDCSATLEAEATGDPCEIAVAAKYLIDAIDAAGTETPTIEWEGAHSQLKIHNGTVMPVRI